MPSFASPYAAAVAAQQLQPEQVFYYPSQYDAYAQYKYYPNQPSEVMPVGHPLPPLSQLLPPQPVEQKPMYEPPSYDRRYYPEQPHIPSPPPSIHESPQKVFAFVSLPGVNQRKRPRRKYHEIERLYHCNFQGCSKAYGTLNHLNAHVSMQQHGPKRHPSEFKELRKQWRKQKREQQQQHKSDN